MDKTSYLRYSFLLSGSNATTFNTNLRKLITLVLAERYGEGLIIHEIIKSIQEKFGIEFTDAEIVSAIRSRGNKEIILIERKEDPVYNRYDLTPKTYEKISGQDTSVTLKNFVKEFLKATPDIEMGEDEIQELLIQFFYATFNSNAQNILALLNKKDILLSQGSFDNFQNNEKIIINKFLDWQNQKKDELIYKIISCCYNYCLLTVRKDENAFRDVLKGKVFYVDANIIFRLMGINKEERQNAIQNFVRRCKEIGIKLKYTNVTWGEVNSTIEHYVEIIRKLLHQQTPICTDAMRRMSGKYANLDFYDQYVRWVRDGNRVGDYVAFTKYLKKMAITAVRNFECETFPVYNTSQERGKFEDWCERFKGYKKQRSRAAYEGAIEADINNFMYLLEKNSSNGKVSFLDVKYYIITADHYFVNWAKEMLPNVIPVVVLPSVWYTIMLRFFGRTSDDYMAFGQFLHQRLGEDGEVDSRLPELCNKILRMQEDVSIKEEIVFEISDNLQTKYQDIEDPNEILQDAIDSIMQRKIEEVESRKNIEISEEKRKLKEEYEKKTKECESKKYDEGVISGREEGIEEEHKRMIQRRAEKKVEENYPLFQKLNFVMWAAIIIGLLGLILFVCFGKGQVRDGIIAVIELIGVLCSMLVIPGAFFVYKNWFCSLDKERLLKKYIKQCEKEFQ